MNVRFFDHEYRYTKYKLSLQVKSKESYKLLISFVTRTPHLKLLSFSKVIWESSQGEYEWYSKLVDTFNSLKLDVDVLQNKSLFENWGHFYPKNRSLKYLYQAQSVEELNTTQVWEHLDLSNAK